MSSTSSPHRSLKKTRNVEDLRKSMKENFTLHSKRIRAKLFDEKRNINEVEIINLTLEMMQNELLRSDNDAECIEILLKIQQEIAEEESQVEAEKYAVEIEKEINATLSAVVCKLCEAPISPVKEICEECAFRYFNDI